MTGDGVAQGAEKLLSAPYARTADSTWKEQRLTGVIPTGSKRKVHVWPDALILSLQDSPVQRSIDKYQRFQAQRLIRCSHSRIQYESVGEV